MGGQQSSSGAGVVVVAALVVGALYSQGAIDLPDLPVLEVRADAAPGCVAKVRQHDGFNRHQLRHAATIAQVGVEEGVGRRGVVIALATAIQESGLANLPYGDRDSLGLFQQRPSMGWGTPQQVQTPRYAARKFFRALKRVDGWRRMRVTEAAQAVQRSAYPDAYAKHEPAARELAGKLLRKCR